MKLTKFKLAIPVIMLLAALFTSSCNSDKNATIELRLTDAPALFDAINIDIQEVYLHSETEGWVAVPLAKPGIYNLLKFSNGMDTLLGKLDLPAGNLSQLRLVLGSNNTIVADGSTYGLDIPSGSTSGLKFNVQQPIEAGVNYKLWIDFDAARSVIKTGNGKYKLKPVIRMFSEATSGAISGTVLPAEAKAMVTATSISDTLKAVPLENGSFLMRGVPAGSYTVVFAPGDGTGYQSQQVSNVAITIGKTTQLQAVTLIKTK